MTVYETPHKARLVRALLFLSVSGYRQHGKPSKIWIYRDANGQPLMVLYRFDLRPDESGTPRKVFAPLTWCKHSANDSLAWRWQGLSEPRPLLRLDDLAKRRLVPVVLCEGEKASVWGGPRLVRSWRSTDNALESIAAAHSDGLLVLDEIGMCDPRIIGETVYMLGNGTGKARANDRGMSGRQVQEWRLLFLSTGEKTLAQHMAEANKELKAGMEVRLLAVPADASKGLGLFEELHGFDDAAALSDALKARVSRCYGTPALAFLSALCVPAKLRAYAAMVRSTLERFTTQALPASASGQAQRAATRFGLAAAAGELATALGVTGWPDGLALQSAHVCLDAWLAERGGAGNLEGDAIVARLRGMVERYGESRFTRWDSIAAKTDDHAPRTADRLGFRRTMDHGIGDSLYTSVTYYFLGTTWRDEVFKGMNLRNVNRELVARGILEPSGDGKAAQSVTLPGMPKGRVYVVNSNILLSD